jgi:hypothetical protein
MSLSQRCCLLTLVQAAATAQNKTFETNCRILLVSLKDDKATAGGGSRWASRCLCSPPSNDDLPP